MAAHVLIVDPNHSAAEVTRAIVSRALAEATLTVVHSLDDARLALRAQGPDILILDPAPAWPQAEALIQQAKQASPDLRVMVLASAPTPALRRASAALGVELYLEKPALLSQLAQALHPLPTSPCG